MGDEVTDSAWSNVPVCPHCGRHYLDWAGESELRSDGDEDTLTCGDCGGLFDTAMTVNVSFRTIPTNARELHIRETKGEIHRLKGVISIFTADDSEGARVIASTFVNRLAKREAELNELEKEETK